VLSAGAWLLTGVYNLRNPPQLIGKNPSAPGLLYQGWLHKRLSGYVYGVASFVKAVTACSLSIQSRSLGFAKYLMVAYGLYDVVSLLLAIKYIKEGNVAEHKKWMIRNFGVGFGSVWVRFIGAIWAACDLDFMKKPDMYRKMNDVVLMVSFKVTFKGTNNLVLFRPGSRKACCLASGGWMPLEDRCGRLPWRSTRF